MINSTVCRKCHKENQNNQGLYSSVVPLLHKNSYSLPTCSWRGSIVGEAEAVDFNFSYDMTV